MKTGEEKISQSLSNNKPTCYYHNRACSRRRGRDIKKIDNRGLNPFKPPKSS